MDIWTAEQLLDLEDIGEEIMHLAGQIRTRVRDSLTDTVRTPISEAVARMNELIDRVGTFADE
jgi:hypothetical protein